MRLKPTAAQSRVKHSSTEPLRSLILCVVSFSFKTVTGTKSSQVPFKEMSKDGWLRDKLEVYPLKYMFQRHGYEITIH